MKRIQLALFQICLGVSFLFSPNTQAQKGVAPPPVSGQTAKGLRITILAVTRVNVWRSKTPTEDGEYIEYKAKEGQEFVVVRIRVTVVTPADAIGFSPVNLEDSEGTKIAPLVLPWNSGKFARGQTVVQEIVFRTQKGAKFKTFQAEDVSLNIEKFGEKKSG